MGRERERFILAAETEADMVATEVGMGADTGAGMVEDMVAETIKVAEDGRGKVVAVAVMVVAVSLRLTVADSEVAAGVVATEGRRNR